VRLRIKGEITPERLVEAYAKALEKIHAVRPGAKIYGANLYLTPFDADGMAFDLADDRGNSLIMNISAPPGTVVKPALSAEAEQRREAAREDERQRDARANELQRQHEAEMDRRYQLRAALEAKAKKSHLALNSVTDALLASAPERLAEELNRVIRFNWESFQPTEPNGPNKGEPKPMPVFSLLEGRLQLSTKSWKQPKIVPNPVGSLKGSLIAPMWTYAAWVASTVAFVKVLEQLSGSLPDDIPGDHLPVLKSVGSD